MFTNVMKHVRYNKCTNYCEQPSVLLHQIINSVNMDSPISDSRNKKMLAYRGQHIL